MKKFIEWFTTSSADPLKFSLFIRGLLTVAGAWLLHAVSAVCGLGLYCLGLDQTLVNQVVEFLTTIAYAVALLFGSAMALWGLLRKFAHGRWSAM